MDLEALEIIIFLLSKKNKVFVALANQPFEGFDFGTEIGDLKL